MSDQKNQSNDPVSFVDARVYTPKSGGKRYIWSKTFDLKAVERELGTSVVTLKVVVPKKVREGGTEDDRLIVISPSEPKYLPRANPGGGKGGPRPRPASDGEVVL